MAAPPENAPTLLEDILSKLSTLPGRRRLTATVLISQPRKKAAATVFPYAPKIEEVPAVEQDVLLLIAENKDTQQTEDQSQSDATCLSPGAYVAAIEANLYIFPTTHSVVVYISKVDTTGQGQRPSPTRAATVALLEHIVRRWFAGGPSEGSPGWNVWVHLFARAQNQYLFPASIEHPGKKVLSDAGLVKWWKAVMDNFVSGCAKDEKTSGRGRLRAEPYVALPGATDDEAIHLLKTPLRKPEATTGYDWRYGHPYSTLPSSTSSSLARFPLLSRCSPLSILELIPYFPDDPKSRFIAELMDSHTTVSGTVIPPPAKRRRIDEQGTSQPTGNGETTNLISQNEAMWVDPLESVSIEEFWERMTFRQECSLGAVVAFFVVYVHTSPIPQLPPDGAASLPGSATEPLPKRLELPPGQVVSLLAKLNSLDFGTTEKSVQSTALLQQGILAAAKGYVVLADGLPGEGNEGAVLLSGETGTSQNEEELFARYISRSVELNNPDLPPKDPGLGAAPVVTVLTARRKKKVA